MKVIYLWGKSSFKKCELITEHDIEKKANKADIPSRGKFAKVHEEFLQNKNKRK